jgi:hypothetical protein
VTDDLYKEFTKKRKQSLTFIVNPPGNLKFAKIFEDSVFEETELKLLQVSIREKDDSIDGRSSLPNKQKIF